MKKNLFLHIGMFKTGTKTLQRFLNENRELLKKYSFYVPGDELNPHHVLPISLIKKITGKTLNTNVEIKLTFEEYVDILKRQITKTECQNIILSSESFCDFVHPDIRMYSKCIGKQIFEIFKEFNINIIIYLRKMDDYLLSFYKEILKYPSTDITYSEFIDWSLNNDSFHIFPSIILDYYSEIFGRNSLILKIYSRNTLYKKDIVADFLKTINCHYKNYDCSIDDNISLSNDEAFLKLIFNTTQNNNTELNDFINNFFISTRRVDITNDKVVNQKILNENIKLINEYGIDLPSVIPLFNPNINLDLSIKFIIFLLSTIIKQNDQIIKLKN